MLIGTMDVIYTAVEHYLNTFSISTKVRWCTFIWPYNSTLVVISLVSKNSPF